MVQLFTSITTATPLLALPAEHNAAKTSMRLPHFPILVRRISNPTRGLGC